MIKLYCDGCGIEIYDGDLEKTIRISDYGRADIYCNDCSSKSMELNEWKIERRDELMLQLEKESAEKRKEIFQGRR